jgi:hypothetical protein
LKQTGGGGGGGEEEESRLIIILKFMDRPSSNSAQNKLF